LFINDGLVLHVNDDDYTFKRHVQLMRRVTECASACAQMSSTDARRSAEPDAERDTRAFVAAKRYADVFARVR